MPEPSLPDLAHLPAWGQIVAVISFLGMAFGVVRSGWKAEEKQHAHEGQTDTVVVSGAFADSRPIKDLADAIGELRDGQDDARRETRRMVEELQGIRDDIKRGVTVKIAAGD